MLLYFYASSWRQFECISNPKLFPHPRAGVVNSREIDTVYNQRSIRSTREKTPLYHCVHAEIITEIRAANSENCLHYCL